MVERLEWKTGDTGLSNTVTCKDVDETAANLTGATVRWVMAPWNAVGRYAGAAVVAATLSGSELVDLSAGQVARDRDDSSDTATAGEYVVEIEVTYSSGDVQTFPEDDYLYVTVRADLD